MAIYGVIIFGFFVLLFIGAIMGITAHGRISRLEEQLRRLSLKSSSAGLETPTTAAAKPVAPPLAGDHATRAATPQRLAAKGRAPDPKISKPAELPKASAKKPVKTPAKPKRSLEETLGAQWSVWLGGLTLAIGAIFLLRFSIEAGVFTPALRVLMTGGLGLALLAVGDWLRRKDGALDALPKPLKEALKDREHNAYIPGVLTAVGIVSVLGAIYAAHALFEFIGPVPAFALLALTSLGALGLSLLHGPKMAGLGLAASLVTPFLIESEPPNYLLLFGYLAIIGAASLSLARRRSWGWLNIVTLFGLLAWTVISVMAVKETASFSVWMLYMAAIFAASLWTARGHALSLERYKAKHITLVYDPVIAAIWTALAGMVIIWALIISKFALVPFYAAIVVAGACVAVGIRMKAHRLQTLIGCVLGVALALGFMWGSGKEVSAQYIGMSIGALFALGLGYGGANPL